MYDQDQPFLSYWYNITSFLLTKDSLVAITSGFQALETSIQSNRLKESELLVKQIAIRFPQFKDHLSYYYGFELSKQNRYKESEIYLKNVSNPFYADRISFLYGYHALKKNQPEEAVKWLHQIDSGFAKFDSVRIIKNSLSHSPSFHKKTKWIAVPLSMIIPGSGQAYTGLYFDALQNFGFNVLVGYSSYASWRYESTKKRKNYVLPILSSLAASIFYLTNIYNAANSVDKHNLYQENQFYNNILHRWEATLQDKNFFIGYHIPLEN